MISLFLFPGPGVFAISFVNEAGHFMVSGWIWAALLIAILAGVYLYFRPVIRNLGSDPSGKVPDAGPELIQTSLYAGGHPEIREAIQPCFLYTDNGMIHFGKGISNAGKECIPVGSIPMDTLVDIRVEDVFTMKRKMTPERWLKSKDFLQVLNDRKEEDIAFVVIEWQKGEEHYITNLCVEGNLAMELALAKRNLLYRKCRAEMNQNSAMN